MKSFVIAFILVFSCFHLVFSQQEFGKRETHYLADSTIRILTDVEKRYTINTILNAKDWQKASFKEGLVLPKPGTYWLSFSLKNISEKENWILEFPDIHNSELEVYELNHDSSILQQVKAGFDLQFYPRVYDHKNYFIDLHLKKGESRNYVVKITSRYRTSYAAYIRSINFEFAYFLKEYYWLGFFYGILVIMALYNFFLFVFSKEKIYSFYVLYVICGALYTLSEDGIGFHYVWPDFPEMNHFIFLWSPFLFLGTFILYSVSFLKIHTKFPKLIWPLVGMLFVNFLLVLISHVVPPFVRAISYVIPFVYVYCIAWYQFKNGHRISRFFLFGFSVVLISFVIYFFRMIQWLPTDLYTYYIFNIGMILEAVIMSYAMGERYRHLKKEKELAQQKIIEQLKENEKLKDKVNRELEEKVAERTSQLEKRTVELSEANEKLKQLTEELNKMNSLLDKDNWELKKQVKEETRSRILQEKVPYEEYLKIYPTDFACLTFLERIKWEQGYSCKKCKSKSFSRDDKTLSRRCTKCKYTESVTAGTLFHGIKFPLNKAFYIVYDTYDEKGRSTIDKLATVIDLRRVTVWMFRKKVLDAYNRKPRLKDSGWESLILNEEE